MSGQSQNYTAELNEKMQLNACKIEKLLWLVWRGEKEAIWTKN